MDTQNALSLAREKDLDLIEVAGKANPPVCKLQDLGKFVYQQQKIARQQKNKRTYVEVKSVRLTPRISKNDMQMRAKQAEKFLNEGNRVQINMALRGREKALKDFAKGRIQEFLQMLPMEYKVDKPVDNQPRGLAMIISKK